MHPTPKPVDTPASTASVTDVKHLIAVWVEPDSSPIIGLFAPDKYADWAELNALTDAVPYPTCFYAAAANGILIRLDHSVTVGDYDEDDYARVTHTWRMPGNPDSYVTGVARRDGRA